MYTKSKSNLNAPSSSPRIRNTVRFSRRTRFAISAIGVVYLVVFHWSLVPQPLIFSASPPHAEVDHCPQSPITNEILVVMRTGASEALEKLPVHFNTTLRCVPNYVVYSDYEETIDGHQVHDVFRDVNKTLIATEPAFAPYRHLQSHGREGLFIKPHYGSGPTGSLDNPNWVMDKFKFMPMAKRALEHQGNATWFVFIEADTYLVWPNLLEYLTNFHGGDALYLGSPTLIGNVTFAHGGSGFIISKPALQRVTQDRDAHLFEYDQLTVHEWAGDAVMGQKLAEVGVRLTGASPQFEGRTPSTIDFNATGGWLKPWCYAPVTYHHMRKHEIQQLYSFERSWRRGNRTTLLYSDVFKGYIQPRLGAIVEDWDNQSKELEPGQDTVPTNSTENCLAVCQAVSTCHQYSYSSGHCTIASQIRHGKKPDAGNEAIHSGWIDHRIARFVDNMDQSCRSIPDAPWHV